MSFIFKGIFLVILYATAIFVPAQADCPEHTYLIGSNQYTWPETPSSDLWIASDCKDENKLLIFRQCLNDTWIPNNDDFEDLCKYENVELPSYDCPDDSMIFDVQVSPRKTICVLNHSGMIYDFFADKSVCIEDTILTMDVGVNIEEQKPFLLKLGQVLHKYNGILPLGARSRYPSKAISKNINYDIEDVELQDIRCGRFGLSLKFNNSVPVHCNEELCGNMCLHLNATTESFSRIIDTCSDYIIAKPTDTFLHRIGCPSGYYRIENDYYGTSNPDACFSIQMFPKPIPVQDVANINVIDSYCNGTILTLNWSNDVFIFKKLSEQFELTDGNHCLFGIIHDEIIQYSDWNSDIASALQLSTFNWDKTMNYSRIKNVDEEVSFLAVKPNGQWTWAVDTVSCIVCMVDIPITTPKLQIKYNIFERKLELDVTDQEFLYREKSSDPGFICFSLLRGIYSNLTVTPIADSVSKYLVEDVGIGQYWCNGHNLMRRRYISSETIFAYGVWFAFEVLRKCNADCEFNAENDLSRFISSFKRFNEFALVMDSTIVEQETAELDRAKREYTFTAYLSLILYSDVAGTLVNKFWNLTHHQLETIYIYEHLSRTPVYNDPEGEMNITSIKSTEYCLHESSLSTEAIIWQIAKIGETIPISQLCYPENITRTCSGDYVNGSFWEELIEIPVCQTFVSKSLLALYDDINNSHPNDVVIEGVKNLLEDTIGILLPMDVFLTSRILQAVGNFTFDKLQNIFSIYDMLMQIDEDVLKVSAFLNSTNILLEALDNILMNHMKHTVTSSVSSDYLIYGNESIHSPLVETYIFDPNINKEISGIALYRHRISSSADVDFRVYSSHFINRNDTLDRLVTYKGADELVVGVAIPETILDIHKNISVAISVFFNDKLFQSTDNPMETKVFKTNGKIISITIHGLDNSNLPSKIPLFFELTQTDNITCGYWSLTSISNWSSNGCSLREIFVKDFQRLAVCECSHLSHFGYIVGIPVETLDHTLSIIAVLTSSFSLFGTVGIFITAVAFPKWRQETTSKIIINFAASVALEMFLVICINLDYILISLTGSTTFNCIAMGLILHYSVLIMFLWMLIIVYFHFNGCVVVFNFNFSHLLLKLTIFVWGVPLLPVLAVLLADRSLYLPLNKDQHKFCHPTGWALYFGVLSPVTLIFFVVSIVIITALSNLRRRSSDATSKDEEIKFRMGFSQIRSSAFVFITLVLTWVFGMLSKTAADAYSVYSYLYCATATIKGLVLFLYFFVFDESVAGVWSDYFRKIKKSEVSED